MPKLSSFAVLAAQSIRVALIGALLSSPAFADEPTPIEEAPPRAEGEGPWSQLILRGGTLIDGTGAPPIGPVDIVIESNRIQRIESVGYPGVPIDQDDRPELAEGGHEIDVSGMWILPGFVDMPGILTPWSGEAAEASA